MDGNRRRSRPPRAASFAVASFVLFLTASARGQPPTKPLFIVRLDGSGVLEITREAVRWRTKAGKGPVRPIRIDRDSWNTTKQAARDHGFELRGIDLRRAEVRFLEPWKRAVAIRAWPDRLWIELSAVAPACQTFTFTVEFTPPAAPAARREPVLDLDGPLAAFERAGAHEEWATLRIRARLEGQGRIFLRHGHARFEHVHGATPPSVWLNGEPWDVSMHPRRTCAGPTRYLPFGLARFDRVEVLEASGGDLIGIEPRGDRVIVHLAGRPPGVGLADLTLRVPVLRMSPAALPSSRGR